SPLLTIAEIKIAEPGNGFPKSARAIENSMPVVTAAASATLAAFCPPVTPAALLSLIANSSACVSAVPGALVPTFPAEIDPAACSPTAFGEDPLDPGTVATPPPWRLIKSTLYVPVPLPHRENK